ncbi:hypothetical protein NIASO_10295 [Niabella soli DSM 19437]|uniref:Uncharacterized protein n=1 Tax=Niabella soli DSM 19437 TaxID=929713 RepID=W0F6X5_9BACT|nr:hypothetical protein NIASO_10295 [Niabella soli DSM 19437]
MSGPGISQGFVKDEAGTELPFSGIPIWVCADRRKKSAKICGKFNVIDKAVLFAQKYNLSVFREQMFTLVPDLFVS